jgi:hypothetical protein
MLPTEWSFLHSVNLADWWLKSPTVGFNRGMHTMPIDTKARRGQRRLTKFQFRLDLGGLRRNVCH